MGRPSVNITIVDSIMSAGHGGVVVGSEMSGDVHDVVARNLHFENLLWGALIRTTRGRGGLVENVLFKNITMKHLEKEGVSVDTFYTKSAEEHFSDRTPVVRHITFEDIVAESKLGIRLVGLKERHIDEITLTNVHMSAEQEMVMHEADNVHLVNVTNTVVVQHA